MYKKKKRNVKSTFLMSNIYVFLCVGFMSSVAKRRKFEEVIGQRLVSAANLLLEISAGA